MAFYHDQHLAWQQRVSKELSAASRFLTQYGSFNRPGTSSSINSSYSKHSKHDQGYSTNKDLRHLNVFAEVRGKYARPAPANYQKPDNPLLAPKENSLVSRPATSGSLRPRSQSSKKPSGEVQMKASEVRPRSQYRKRYRSVTGESQKNPNIDRISFEGEEMKTGLENLENNGNPGHLGNSYQNDYREQDDHELQAENADQVDDLEENPEDFRDKGSQITTSSQRRYILELEALLREEKMKRFSLEENLKKITEEKKKHS